MDRHQPEKLPAIQISFIQHLVSPLFHACAEAGIIPGVVESYTSAEQQLKKEESVEEEERDEEMATSSDAKIETDEETDEDAIADMLDEAHPVRKVISIILTNLQVNYDGWESELPLEDQPKELKRNTSQTSKTEEEGKKEEEEENEGDREVFQHSEEPAKESSS